MSSKPHFGRTKTGLPVHARTADHRTGFARRTGVAITDAVGTMTCAVLFTLISLVSLPDTLVQAGILHRSVFPHWLVGAGLVGLVQWVAQTFLQLVLLSVIIVGQNAQAEAGDARAAKTFEDTEKIVDAMDTRTEGGLHDVLTEVKRGRDDIAGLAEAIRAALAPQAGNFPPSAERVVPRAATRKPAKGGST